MITSVLPLHANGQSIHACTMITSMLPARGRRVWGLRRIGWGQSVRESDCGWKKPAAQVECPGQNGAAQCARHSAFCSPLVADGLLDLWDAILRATATWSMMENGCLEEPPRGRCSESENNTIATFQQGWCLPWTMKPPAVRMIYFCGARVNKLLARL